MHDTYRREAFPQDTTLSTFSSTNIYWLPDSMHVPQGKGEGPKGSKEPDDARDENVVHKDEAQEPQDSRDNEDPGAEQSKAPRNSNST